VEISEKSQKKPAARGPCPRHLQAVGGKANLRLCYDPLPTAPPAVRLLVALSSERQA